jgi:hypothetical protein
MTSTTTRNAKALTDRNGSTLPKTTPTKAVAKGNKAVAPSNKPEAQAPKAPAPQAAPEGIPCHCGCGSTAKPGRSYLPGHDARHAGQIGRALAAKAPGAEAARDALPAALKAKAERFAANRAAEATRKAVAAKIREDAKTALTAALAAI